MENFVVSARKYRPQTFKSVIGQFNITQTLKSAVKNKQLAHAYLFCGPRGVGKTTCARIFAKAINCFSPTDDNEPCNECESCIAFNNNRSYNIQELDAASNNSVEDIRNLIDQIRIPPRLGKYSVYIIDEVHMLSSAAFNAFLKTLEEPPTHAVFILATTEKHKILPTILSRCQVFDFNRIRTEDTVNHLRYVAQSEHVEFEESALRVIAQKSEGGMRDALSIFDQLVSFTEGKLTYKNTIENLNILDSEYYFKVVDNIVDGQTSELMLIFDEILRCGFDGLTFVAGLAQHFRNLLMSKNPKTVKLVDSGADLESRYLQQAQKCTIALIYNALQKLRDCEINYKASKNQRLLVELTLMDIGFFQHNLQQKKKIGEVVPPQQPATKTKNLPPRPSTTTGIKEIFEEINDKNEKPQVVSKTEVTAPPEPQVINVEETKIEYFSEENKSFEEIWGTLVTMFESQRLQVALKKSNPTIENSTLKLTLTGESQKDLIESVKPKIIKTLQEMLHINDINVEYIILPESEQPVGLRAGSSTSTLSDFEKQNPELQAFVQKLGLKMIRRR